LGLWLLPDSRTRPAMAQDGSASPSFSTLDDTPAASVRFVDGSGAPLANRELWLFCYGDELGHILASQQWIRTNAAGEPVSALPEPCPWLVALHQSYTQPSGKAGHGPAYWVFTASWQLSEGRLQLSPAEGTVTLKRPFVLFNVVASLEWQEAASAQNVADLREGLRLAALNLADVTDGYMSFGPLTILSGGQYWEGADLRVQSANDLRPAAFVGGVVAAERSYNTGFTEPTFKPAAIYLGRKWNGNDAVAGEWEAEAGWRTLVHEWSHYALFLYDEYQNVTGERAYCIQTDLARIAPDAGLASIMAYHYNASELWHPNHIQIPDTVCEDSDQFRVYGEADWLTIEDWYTIQGLSARTELTPLARPSTLPAAKPEDASAWGPLADLVGRAPYHTVLRIPYLSLHDTVALPPPARELTVTVKTEDDLTLTQTVASQVYLLEAEGDPSGVDRILHEGNVRDPHPQATGLFGQIQLLGVRPDDQARVFVDRYASLEMPVLPPGRFTYAVDEPLPEATPLQSDTWLATMDFFYTVAAGGTSTGRLTALDVVISSRNRLAELAASPPVATLCVPDPTVGCHGSGWQQTLVNTAPGVYRARFTPAPGSSELPLYGTVRVQAPGAGELIRWFRDLGGVGPGHMFGGAPLREGVAMVDTVVQGSQPDGCNRVLVMPATDYDALLTGLPVTSTLVSLPVDIDILLAGSAGTCQSEALTDKAVPAAVSPLRLTLTYNNDVVTRRGLDETTLHLLHYDRQSGLWVVLRDPKGVDGDLNWVAAQIEEDGIYAVGADISAAGP
jgi:hypothetical protein